MMRNRRHCLRHNDGRPRAEGGGGEAGIGGGNLLPALAVAVARAGDAEEGVALLHEVARALPRGVFGGHRAGGADEPGLRGGVVGGVDGLEPRERFDASRRE